MKTLFFLIFTLLTFLLYLPTNSHASNTREEVSKKIIELYNFDIGSINFLMTKKEIIEQLNAEGYEHINSHMNKITLRRGSNNSNNMRSVENSTTEYLIEFNYSSEDSLPKMIDFQYTPGKSANNFLPEWDRLPYWNQAVSYAGKICNKFSKSQKNFARISCELDQEQRKYKIRVPQLKGIDNRLFMFELDRGGIKHKVRVQITDSLNQKRKYTSQDWMNISKPHRKDKIIDELDGFSEECKAIKRRAPFISDSSRSNKTSRIASNCAKRCKNYADNINNNGLNTKNRDYWDMCFNTINLLRIYNKNYL